MTAVVDADAKILGSQVCGLARGMRDLVADKAAESEQLRTLSPAIVEEMWASGLMSSFNPVAAGGTEPSFAEMIETWIEMASQDGSFGWIGIANLPSSFAAAAYLPDEGFAEVFTAHDNHVTMGGQFFPNGQGAAGQLPGRPDGHDARHRRRSRGLGARGVQKHARRRPGVGRVEVPDE